MPIAGLLWVYASSIINISSQNVTTSFNTSTLNLLSTQNPVPEGPTLSPEDANILYCVQLLQNAGLMAPFPMSTPNTTAEATTPITTPLLSTTTPTRTETLANSSQELSNTTTTLTPPTTSQDLEIQICLQKLFGKTLEVDMSKLPYLILSRYGITTTPTTTTLSPAEILKQTCLSFKQWLPEVDTSCKNPQRPCFYDITSPVNTYFQCKAQYYNNTKEPSLKASNEGNSDPMIIISSMKILSQQINEYFIYRGGNRERFLLMDYYMWMTGVQFRDSERNLPDYHADFFKNEKWNRRNDSVIVPYGALSRNVYTYMFAIYDNIWNKKMEQTFMRLMQEWPYKHEITNGLIMDYGSDDFYYNPKLEINSAVLHFSSDPIVDDPLPTYLTIRFMHKDSTMMNPVCVYWQYLQSDQQNQPRSKGYWSNYGMVVGRTNTTITECRATHFGTFALLMEPGTVSVDKGIEIETVVMILITFLAILIILVYIIMMLLLKVYSTIFSRMYLYIALSFLLLQICYIYAQTKKADYSGCTAISNWLIFWHVCVVTWVTMESVYHLSKVTELFNEKTNTEAFYNIIGWGFPLTAVVSLAEFPFKSYTELSYCWPYLLGSDIMFYGLPLLALSISIIVLKVITIKAMKKYSKKQETEINFQRAQRSIISSIVILFTFLIMWNLGTFGVRFDSTIIQDIISFVIPGLNVLLAIEIVYFFGLKNDEVQDAFYEQKRIKMHLKLRTYEHVQGIAMKVHYEPGDDKDILAENKEEDKFNSLSSFNGKNDDKNLDVTTLVTNVNQIL